MKMFTKQRATLTLFYNQVIQLQFEKMETEKEEYKKKLHDHVHILSSVKSTVGTALNEVDQALCKINDELDVIAAEEHNGEEEMESPNKKPRPAEVTLDLTEGSLDTWKVYFNPEDVNMLKEEDMLKGQAEANKITMIYDELRKEGQGNEDFETTENKHNTMRNVMRDRIPKSRVVNRGGRYLAFCLLFKHHQRLLLEDAKTRNLTNDVFTQDVQVQYRAKLIEWRRFAVKPGL
jgi:hypothetical protein